MSDLIHSVLISYNRPELTEQAIRSYWASVRLPHSLVVVDNGSHQDTVKMLRRMAKMHGFQFLELGENRYPGYATNFGWALMPEETTLLHRADNDFVFLHGWDQHGRPDPHLVGESVLAQTGYQGTAEAWSAAPLSSSLD